MVPHGLERRMAWLLCQKDSGGLIRVRIICPPQTSIAYWWIRAERCGSEQQLGWRSCPQGPLIALSDWQNRYANRFLALRKIELVRSGLQPPIALCGSIGPRCCAKN